MIDLYFFLFIFFAWLLARWACIVSRKVPIWVERDWRHQATSFLAQKDVMNPGLAEAESDEISAKPSFSWWTPVELQKKGRCGWVPFAGPALLRDWRSLWSEVWVCTLAVFLYIFVLFYKNELGLSVGLERVFWGIIFFAWLQALTNVDYKTQFLPDIMTLPLLWLGLFVAVLTPGLVSPSHAVQGAIIGYLTLWGLSKAFLLLRKQEGLGGGDLKLAAALGAWCGPVSIMGVIGLSAFIAIGFAIVLLIMRKPFSRFAYGPSLATAGIVAYLFFPIVLGIAELNY